MYKLKYYYLTKEEKEKLQEEFYQTKFGLSIKKRLKRLLIIGIIGLAFSVMLFLTYKNIWEFISGFSLFLASILFITSSRNIKIKKLNEYLVSKKH